MRFFFIIFQLFSCFCTFDHTYNAFFALMVTNPTVVQQVKQIEANLTEANPQFVKFVYNISNLHIRLNTVQLNENSSSVIQKFLKDLPKAMCNVSYSVPAIFEGTAIRSNTTLYGKLNAMSSTVISSVHQKIFTLLNASKVPSVDEHEIFHPKMDIVELGDQKHDDLLQIMSNRTGDFRLSTGDFIKEIVLWNATDSGTFHVEIGRAVLAPCSNFTARYLKPHLISNRVPVSPLVPLIEDF
uniref:AKAP7_NLS domain-containing protein n=1 Tax=Caenorhabditis japonica TaxID=281687 RepID=A0A8R1HPZ8_CAEJA